MLTLKTRLTLWYAGVLAVVLLAFCAATYVSVIADDDDEGHEAAARESTDLEADPRRLLVGLGVGLVAAVAVAAAGGLWIGRRALRPIDRIQSIAARLRGDDLSLRIATEPGEPSDVTTLITAINGMLQRIELSVGGLRRFTADASHELRTPLAGLIATVEVSLQRKRNNDELLSSQHDVLEGLRQLSRLVDALLTLARADAGELPLHVVNLDVGEVVLRAAEPYEPLAADRGIRLSIDTRGSLHASTDPLWLGRAFANLIDNACKFTPRGGSIAIAVAREESQIRISVENSGASLAPEHRARIFERFYRAPSARAATAGFGLGLALARDIARWLGGDLVFVERLAGGARFDLIVATSWAQATEV